jgi:hypothetical protein
MIPSALAAAAPTLETTHRAERGISAAAGKWAVVKIERWRRPNGTVAMVHRTMLDWLPTQSLAELRCTRLNAVAKLAGEADRLAAAE